MWAWGKIPDREFGNEVLKPIRIADQVKQISINDNQDVALLKDDNTVWIWGKWSSLHPDETILQLRPMSFSDIRNVAATVNYIYMVKEDGILCAVALVANDAASALLYPCGEYQPKIYPRLFFTKTGGSDF